jgi:hypothetical protein
MKKHVLALALIATGLAVTAACSAASTGKPLPQAGNVSQTTTTAKAAATSTTEAPTTTTAAKVSTCDAAREALLTGTQTQINTALGQLQVDKTADATAREYADYYLHRDATDAQLRQMDVDLIRTSCSI